MPLTTALSPRLPSSTEQIIIPAPRPFSPFSSSSSSRKFLGTFAGIMREKLYGFPIIRLPNQRPLFGEENQRGVNIATEQR